MLVSGGWDNTVRLWNVATRENIHTLKGHTAEVYAVAFSPDGRIVVSGGWDNTIRLWDVVTAENIHTLKGHTAAISSLAFSPDGKILASGSYDRTIRLWDVAITTNIATLTGHKGRVLTVAFSPDGKMVASGSWDDTVRFWDVATAENINTITEHPGDVWSLAFSPDGKTIATGGETRYIYLWDVATAEKINTFTQSNQGALSVAFSPDGKTIASGVYPRGIQLWEIATARRIGSFSDTYQKMSTVDSVAFSPDGKTIATGSWDPTVRLWTITRCFKITPYPIVSPAIGERFIINIEADMGPKVQEAYFNLYFNSRAIRYVETTGGDLIYLSSTFESDFTYTTSLGFVRFESRFGPGKGTLAKITFEVIDVRESNIRFQGIGYINTPYLIYEGKIIPPEFSSPAVVSITPSEVLSPAIGEQLVFNVNIADGQNVARSELTLDYDQSALKEISRSDGNYLSGEIGNGDGTLETITFEVLDVKASTVSVSGYLVAPNGYRYVPTFQSAEVIEPLLGDINRDGVVSILDVVQVASSLGQVSAGGNPADVNEDGVVNIVDMITVAGAINDAAAAPAVWNRYQGVAFTSDRVQKWLSQAQQLDLPDAIAQKGILFLENLLALLTPKETALLPNYPNPFNPETWIPYQLAEPADVTISIYAVDGTVIRTLNLGHKTAGIYHDQTRAAYWDGKNEVGEAVASGVYFYTLTAGSFNSTRKMLIWK